jgi:XTP/dITP diphosphohydrolase
LLKRIILASKNRYKLEEFREIFNNKALSGLDAYPEIEEVHETGATFQENALIKASCYYDRLKHPVIAEDSGLVVPALKGAPGIYSARYAGPGATAVKNNRKLLQEMMDIEDEQRFAYFICCAVYFDGEQTVTAEGRIEGVITREPRGTGGFGYDPVFLIPRYGKTFAELGPVIKNQISHRRQAFQKLRERLEG